jgi:hypothetical protein
VDRRGVTDKEGTSRQTQGYHLGRIIFRRKEGFSKQNQGTDVYQVRNGLQAVLKGSQQAGHQVLNTNPFVLLLNY